MVGLPGCSLFQCCPVLPAQLLLSALRGYGTPILGRTHGRSRLGSFIAQANPPAPSLPPSPPATQSANPAPCSSSSPLPSEDKTPPPPPQSRSSPSPPT